MFWIAMGRRMTSPVVADGIELDTQQVEILGRNRIKAALIEAGLEVATPERDNGIDLIAYQWSTAGMFEARPVQIKASSNFTFGVDRKYERIPGLIMAFIMGARRESYTIYAMTYAEMLKVATDRGWTDTASWTEGNRYVQTRPSAGLDEALTPFIAQRESWRRFFAPA